MRRNLIQENLNKKEKYLEIQTLKNQGYSNSRIRVALNLTKAQFHFYCRYKNPDQVLIIQQKHKAYSEKRKDHPFHILIRRVYSFRHKGVKADKFTYLDVIAKFGESPVCALTGLPIDYKDGSTYNLDHIIPLCKGGTSNLDNLQLLLPMANQLKGGLSMDNVREICDKISAYSQKNQG